jgi:hypothetical protein
MAALSRFHVQWEKEPTIHAFFDLCDAAERANEVLTMLETGEAKDHETRLQVIGLKLLLNAAMHARELTHDEPFVFGSPYAAVEEEPLATPASMFPVGTIVSCPECGEGLYKMTTETSLVGLVLDEGTTLAPLNRSIPPRHAWSTLMCLLCGGRLLRDGKIHTFQHGWI